MRTILPDYLKTPNAYAHTLADALKCINNAEKKGKRQGRHIHALSTSTYTVPHYK